MRLTSLDDLRVLHGYVLEPALRSATAVAVECEQRLTRLPPVQFVDPELGYPYTLERALDAAMRLFRDPASGCQNHALRSDPELRRRWQARFDRVLVDECQDIEPAQELLVRVLAAPQDCLFCVGDEPNPVRMATRQRPTDG